MNLLLPHSYKVSYPEDHSQTFHQCQSLIASSVTLSDRYCCHLYIIYPMFKKLNFAAKSVVYYLM